MWRGAKVAKSLNVQVGINVEGGIFWKKLVHNSNKRGVECGKNRLPLTIFWSEIVSVIHRGALKTNCI